MAGAGGSIEQGSDRTVRPRGPAPPAGRGEGEEGRARGGVAARRVSLALLGLDGGDGTKAQAALDRAVQKPADETALPELGRELRGLEAAGRNPRTLTLPAISTRGDACDDDVPADFSPNRLAAAAAALGLLAAAPLCAAEQNPGIDVHFGVEAGVDLGATLKLRPTVQQPLFVWVLNTSDKDIPDAIVEVQAGGVPVDGTVQHAAPKAKSKTPVVFGKAPAAAPPAPPMPVAPPAKPQPPTLQEVKGPLQVVVLDATGKDTLFSTPLPVARPDEYVQVTDISYNPEAKEGNPRNTLTVKVKALGGFGGPPSRVDLVLRPTASPD